MTNKRRLHIYALLLSIITSSTVFSQYKVIITLQRPPLNQLNISHIWSLTLKNTTSADLKIYLKGFASEEKRGTIVEGESKIFTLPTGENRYGYNDFKNGTVNWINKDLQEILLRTGNAPEGNYTICVTAFNEDNEIIGKENCIEHTVDLLSSQEIMLVSPDDGENIDIKENLTFTWMPINPASKDGYKLKLVEIIGNQSIDEAINKNNALFSEKGIKTTTLLYPISAKKLELGKKYGWQVSIKGIDEKEEIKSETWSFSIISSEIVEEKKEIKNTLDILKYFIDLKEEPDDNYTVIYNDTLNVQFMNDYSSNEKLIINIFDESLKLINEGKTKELDFKVINGLNRISINTKKLKLQEDKIYLLKITNHKKNYYINFKIRKGYEK